MVWLLCILGSRMPDVYVQDRLATCMVFCRRVLDSQYLTNYCLIRLVSHDSLQASSRASRAAIYSEDNSLMEIDNLSWTSIVYVWSVTDYHTFLYLR